MRIGYDAKRAFHNFSGLGNYSRNIITLLSRYYPSDTYYLYTPYTRVLENFPPPGAVTRTPGSFLARKFRSAWRTMGISKMLRTDRIDIYHGLSNELPVKIPGRTRSVVTIHDLIFIRYPELYPLIDRAIYHRKLNYAVKSSNHIVAASEQTRRDIIKFTDTPPEKISVIYQSCDTSFGERAVPQTLEAVRKKYDLEEPFILSIGTIEKRKNLLSTVKALHAGKTGLPLVIVGRETDYAAEVRSWITQHGIRNVRFLKNVPMADLPALYRLALMFVYPSSFEGFGIPVLEAITSGVPVIAGTGSCLEETGGPGSIYIDPADIEGYAREIERLAGDEQLRQNMVEKGKVFAGQFSGEKTIGKLHGLYESII